MTDLTPELEAAIAEGYARRDRSDMAPTIAWFEAQYLPRAEDADHPWASPLLAPTLAGLPPAHVVIAGCDPLRDEGLAYVDRLRADGVPVTGGVYEGMFHGFFNLGHVLPEAADASSAAYAAVRDWFSAR